LVHHVAGKIGVIDTIPAIRFCSVKEIIHPPLQRATPTEFPMGERIRRARTANIVRTIPVTFIRHGQSAR
jgi:hypothetical protein